MVIKLGDGVVDISVYYDLFNVALALPINFLHFFQLYGRRGEPPSIVYTWISLILVLLYASSFRLDVMAALHVVSWSEVLNASGFLLNKDATDMNSVPDGKNPDGLLWSWAISDALATWTWLSTSYMFFLLSREGSTAAVSASPQALV